MWALGTEPMSSASVLTTWKSFWSRVCSFPTNSLNGAQPNPNLLYLSFPSLPHPFFLCLFFLSPLVSWRGSHLLSSVSTVCISLPDSHEQEIVFTDQISAWLMAAIGNYFQAFSEGRPWKTFIQKAEFTMSLYWLLRFKLRFAELLLILLQPRLSILKSIFFLK